MTTSSPHALAPVTIRSLACAVPEHRLPQSEVAQFARSFFGDAAVPQRLLAVFDNAGIDERQLARPVPWYRSPRGFPAKNAVFEEVALSLGERAGAQALRESGLDPGAIGAIVFVTSTGIATPSLDATLAQTLGLADTVMRVPIWGLGCGGGAAGVSRAAALAAGLNTAVLLICVEICSVTFVHEDRRPSNVVATALFGDGAAAMVVAPGQSPGPRVLGGYSQLLPDTQGLMGWDLAPTGLAVRFSTKIPAITTRVAPMMMDAVCRRYALARPPEQLVLHPGGPKVIDAYEAALALPEGTLHHERAVLRAHGNMSSPTVLFVLRRVMDAPPPAGAHGLVLGLGPGFCAEAALLRWPQP